MAIVSQSDGSIGSIGQAILRSDICSTDGELRNFTEGESIALKGEASPALEMSAALMDRSDPSEKPSYGRTFFYRWQNDVIIQWGKV